MQKPITVARAEYMNTVCNATNNSGLPAFVVCEVLERVLNEVRKSIDIELKRDTAEYRKSVMEESVADEIQG